MLDLRNYAAFCLLCTRLPNCLENHLLCYQIVHCIYCIAYWFFFTRLTLDINIRSATEYIIIKNKLVRRYLQKTGSCNF